jgi:hypothetical protein
MITLISYDNTDKPERTLRVLQYCASLMEFAAVVLVCRVQPQGVQHETIHLVNEHGYAAAMDFEVGGLYNYVGTQHALCIHYDGFILNPKAWDTKWLDYDFIGSPWPGTLCHKFPNYRVGNTGFCLKSREFIYLSHELSPAHHSSIPGDVFTCQMQRARLEDRGMKFAPVEVAAAFGWELNIEEYPKGRPDAFGFHNFGGKSVPSV